MTGTYFSIIKWSGRPGSHKFSENASATFKFYEMNQVPHWRHTILRWPLNLSASGPFYSVRIQIYVYSYKKIVSKATGCLGFVHRCSTV